MTKPAYAIRRDYGAQELKRVYGKNLMRGLRYSLVVNLLLPDKLAASIVKMLFANRTDDEDPVFPARYSWCFTDERLTRMLSAIGYREVVVMPFYGHSYYQSFPLVRDVNAYVTKLARRNDWRAISSHAYVAVRK